MSRVNRKEWDFRDDYTGFVTSVSLYSCFPAIVNLFYSNCQNIKSSIELSRRHLINSSVVFVIKGFTVYQMQNRSSYFKSFLSSLQSHSCGEPCIMLEVRIKSNQEEKIQTFFKNFCSYFFFYFSSVWSLVSGQP